MTVMKMMMVIIKIMMDRLQNDDDACVKYDSVKKIWIYLHRLDFKICLDQ